MYLLLLGMEDTLCDAEFEIERETEGERVIETDTEGV